jgi:hypothetical protein
MKDLFFRICFAIKELIVLLFVIALLIWNLPFILPIWLFEICFRRRTCLECKGVGHTYQSWALDEYTEDTRVHCEVCGGHGKLLGYNWGKK